MAQFMKAYIKSMRLYYSFVTGIAGWIGVSYYEFLSNNYAGKTIEVAPSLAKKLIILMILFLSWGVNQIINDYLGRKEDAVNAPERPMITGELNPLYALIVSGILLFMAGLVTWFYLEKIAVVFLLLGVLLNILYEIAKGHGLIGNMVFGVMISMATLYGVYSSGPTNVSIIAPERLAVIILIWVINGLMTFYTYFKDYQGDKLAGKHTIIVKLGISHSRIIALTASCIPVILFIMFTYTGLLWVQLNRTFVILGILAVFLQVWTGIKYFLAPTGEETYSSLKINFQACVCSQAALIALYDPNLAIWLFIFSYIFVGFLFDLHKNSKA